MLQLLMFSCLHLRLQFIRCFFFITYDPCIFQLVTLHPSCKWRHLINKKRHWSLNLGIWPTNLLKSLCKYWRKSQLWHSPIILIEIHSQNLKFCSDNFRMHSDLLQNSIPSYVGFYSYMEQERWHQIKKKKTT